MKKIKSKKIVFLIAFAGTFIPAWTGDWFLSNTQTNSLNDSYAILACICLAASIWGTSFGFFYLTKVKYGILSGLGKWFVIAAGIGVFYLTGGTGHPYCIFLGISLAMMWSVVDFFRLYFVAKKINS